MRKRTSKYFSDPLLSFKGGSGWAIGRRQEWLGVPSRRSPARMRLNVLADN